MEGRLEKFLAFLGVAWRGAWRTSWSSLASREPITPTKTLSIGRSCRPRGEPVRAERLDGLLERRRQLRRRVLAVRRVDERVVDKRERAALEDAPVRDD